LSEISECPDISEFRWISGYARYRMRDCQVLINGVIGMWEFGQSGSRATFREEVPAGCSFRYGLGLVALFIS
jgi:hypothetical protein